MDLREETSKLETLSTNTSRRLSSASSVFYSANPSPFFSPCSPKSQFSESNRTDAPQEDDYISSKAITYPEMEMNVRLPESDIPTSQLADDPQIIERVSSSMGMSNETASTHSQGRWIEYSRRRGRHKKVVRQFGILCAPNAASLSTSRIRNCDVYVGLYGRKPPLLRFVNWLRAELEVQGVSCFACDRARCGNSRKQRIVERAMDVCSFGVVIITRKSFKNPYTIEELRFFSSKKNLVPLFFDVAPSDCLVRDIIEKRGELWEKHGGELWNLYGGLEKEWKEAIYGLSRIDEWKLEAHNGNWRECILRAVTLLAMRLGRRSVVERLGRWKEKVEKEEFPLPRNENFTGRKKELSELEFMLFGDVTGDSERDYFEIKTKPKRRNLTISWSRSDSLERQRDFGKKKGKDPVVWKESEKEIEMQSTSFPQLQLPNIPRPKVGRKYARRKRSMKIVYGKGVSVVSGESGIGKTELLLEFAYRYHQRYKMVLWIGGESRYIRQNYLNLWPLVEADVGIHTCAEKSRIRSFEEQEEAAMLRVRRELMRNLPYLVIIDNLENEKDWWDHRLIMDLLPRFGGETHFIISTRLPRVMNLEPMKLSYLSGVEALSLMQGSAADYPLTEIDALRVIEEKLGRITLGLAIVGAILSELPINPTRLLDTINRMPLRDFSWNGKEGNTLRKNTFLLQLFEVCFSIFDHADGPRSLATRMVQASGWFAPAPVPISLLAAAAHKIPEKYKGTRLWKKILHSLPCGFTSYTKKSEAEAASMLLRFNIARNSTKQGHVYLNEIVKLYARRRGVTGVAHAMVQAVISRASVVHHPEHLWAACFLIFGFGNDPIVVELKIPDLLVLVREVVLPLAIRSFLTFSRCSAALELLRLCTNALETADQAFVTPVDKWLDKSLCWKPVHTNAQLNPSLWQEMALARATVLETRAKLMLRGGQFDIADDLIRKAIFIRTSISGENHPDTLSAKETLAKITRLLANVQAHT
ncbi:DNA repair protein RadA [Bienertia sinuspersici]